MKYKLDLDTGPDFEGWAFIHFHSSTPGYAFADSLNRLYDYSLARIDDMELDGNAWPFYRYEDTTRHLVFFLAERPAAEGDLPWEAGDKLLIVKGDTAERETDDICADFTDNSTYDEGDLLARDHAELLAMLLADFTVANRLDFETEPLSRKAQKERAAVMQHCDAILTHIEQHHLDLSDDERMRMELMGR